MIAPRLRGGRIGPFRIVAPIGEGGFAPVFLAVEEHGGVELRTVALKLFAPDELADLTRDRIIEEARALCRVEHPNVVRFFQLVEDTAEGVLGLAMEHVRGRSLGDRLDAERVLSVDATLEVGVAVAAALAAVHAAGLVHRDVKPGNVIDAGGVFKLIDFGIALRARALVPAHGASTAPHAIGVPWFGGGATREILVSRDTAAAPDDPHPSKTGTDAIAGTMGYIDPACFATGEPADPSSDLYALGAMLFECLTGRLPASAGGTGDSLSRMRMTVAMGVEAPPAIRSLVPAIPEGVARLVDALVAPRRKDRPKRAEWVASELERLRRVQRSPMRMLPEGGPFRGLASFDERHRDVFLGRTGDIASALELLRTRGLLALVGASGSGKSSLARAGVLPAIVDGSLGAWPPHWTAVTFSPGANPQATLLSALRPRLDGAAPPADPDALAATLAGLVEVSSVGLVILVDALEEAVTVAAPSERAWLARFLAALSARPTPGLRAVVTARRDLLDPLLADPALGAALTRAVQLVQPLSAIAWTEAVTERLAAYDVTLEDDALRAEIARQLESVAEAMPLVEFGLARLWEQRDSARRVISRASLHAIGGLGGALAQHAEATLLAIHRAHGAQAVVVTGDVLLALTTPQGTRVSRTRAELAQYVRDARLEAVLGALERARLVVSEDGRVTIAHEILLTRWSRLAEWVRAHQRDRELARTIEEAEDRWTAHPGADLLLRGRPLREARALAAARPALLSAPALGFVQASRRNVLRSTSGIVGLTASVFVAAAVLGIVTWDAERQARTARVAAEHEKTEIAKITQTFVEASKRPPEQRARDLAELVQAKHACEKQLARCADAGAQAPAAPASD